MKKLFITLLICLFSSPVMAAWSVYTMEYVRTFDHKNEQELSLLKVTGTSDAGNSGDLKMSTGLIATHGADQGRLYWERLQGGFLYAVEFVPGAVTPTTQTTITIDTADGTLIFSEELAVAGTGEMFSGKVDSDFLVPLIDFIFAATTLAADKTAIFYIWILR